MVILGILARRLPVVSLGGLTLAPVKPLGSVSVENQQRSTMLGAQVVSPKQVFTAENSQERRKIMIDTFDQEIYDEACRLANMIGMEKEAAILYRSIGCEEEAEILDAQENSETD